MKRILWICGRLPSPLFSGDALYSAGLLKALAKTNDVALTLVGTHRTEAPIGDHILGLPNTVCVGTPPARSSALSSLISSLPRDAYNLRAPELKQTLGKLLKQHWDWIVVDHAYSAGTLSAILRERNGASICYVAHNAEGLIRTEIASSFSNPLQQTVMRLDAAKYGSLEKRIVKAADAIMCITEADASYFAQFSDNVHVVPPVYLGNVIEARHIDEKSPRALLLLGSFEWIAKQKNLELIVDSLLPSLQRTNVSLNVVGAVPETIRERYRHFSPQLTFHGRIDDVTPFLSSARGGLVADLLGGGFKLKVLDYAFQRLPIFGLKQAMAGTTSEQQAAMFLAGSLDRLGETIIQDIDNLEALNRRQNTLFKLFSARFGLEAGIRRLREVFLTSFSSVDPSDNKTKTNV